MKRNVILFYVGFGLMMSLLVISSCEEKETPEPDPVATSIQLVSGSSQSADVGDVLANPIEVIVKDQDGKAFKGARVTFTIIKGTVTPVFTTTDAAGKAKTTWILGSDVGSQTLAITAFKADGTTALTGSPLTVTATAIAKKDEAKSVELIRGDGQTGNIGMPLRDSVKVLVKDQNGDAFPGVTVSFEVAEGSVSSASKTTLTDGTAAVKWTLGSNDGEQTLTVKVFKSDGTTALTGSPLTVKATAKKDEAYMIVLVSGGDQTANVETALADSVKVLVTDQNGDAFSGATVSFTVTEGSVSSATKITDTDGHASVKWTLGPTIGTQTLLASSSREDGTGELGGSPVYIHATAGSFNDITDYDGNTYTTVEIGTQTWMAENLKVTHYPNGDAISLVSDNTVWADLADNDTDEAYCFYNNNANGEADIYGALYTYAAAKKACPTGWHLPSDAEWTVLTDYLGGISVAGGKMKEVGTTHWRSPNSGATNSSGFTAIPGGARKGTDGTFASIGTSSLWWSSTENGSATTYGYLRILYSTGSYGIRTSTNKSSGMSVRCVKD